MGKSGSAAGKSFDIPKALVWQAYYYGRFYRTRLYLLLQRINTTDALGRKEVQAAVRLSLVSRAVARDVRDDPALFAHWRWARTSPSPNCDEKSGVTGDCHAPLRGSPGVQVPRATRLCA